MLNSKVQVYLMYLRMLEHNKVLSNGIFIMRKKVVRKLEHLNSQLEIAQQTTKLIFLLLLLLNGLQMNGIGHKAAQYPGQDKML